MTLKQKRIFLDKLFSFFCRSITYLSILILFLLLFHVLKAGFSWLDWQLITSFPSRFASKAGLKSGLFGSLYLVAVTIAFSVPIGIGTAIYLQEYAAKNKITQLIKLNISNLAGMPSIIYGLIGLAIFVRFLGFDRSILAGGLTLALLILPVIIIASQEALAAVPRSLRDAAYALGARQWQVVIFQVLPAALPGIMTGIILAVSRSIGETAPLIIIGALSYAAFIPTGVMDSFTALPIQIYNWASRPQQEFQELAAGGILVLLLLLFVLNGIAVFIRQRYQRFS